MTQEELIKKLEKLEETLGEAEKKKEEKESNTENSMGQIGFPIQWPKNPNVKISNLDEIPTPPEEIRVSNLDDIEFPSSPDEIRVSNLDEIQLPKPEKFPDSINIKKPAWLPLAYAPLRPIKELLEDISGKLDNKSTPLAFPKDDKEAIPVRITNHQPQLINGGGGGGVPKVKSTETPSIYGVPVVNPDGTNISGGGGSGNGAILDGVDTGIKATVFDYANSNPLGVVLRDTNGDYVSVGGGTQYTEDAAAAANPVGNTLILVREDARAGSLTTTDGDNVAARGNNKGELYVIDTDANAKLTTIDGRVDGIEGLLTTIDADTGSILTSVDGIEALLTTIDADTSNLSVVGGGTEAAAIRVTIANNSTGVLSVDDNGGNISIDDGGNIITVDGTVTVTGVSTLAEQQTQTTHLATIAGDTTSIQTAVEILDNAISGSEMQVDVVAALPAGTNALGKLLPPDIDVTAHTNYAKKYYTNSGAVTDGIVWSPAAGKRFHVVSMYLQTSAAATITLEDDKVGGDEAIWKGEFAANQGMTINFGEKYPLASGEDAADLIITTSAGNIYVTVTGYEI